jgi:hypothetical protein
LHTPYYHHYDYEDASTILLWILQLAESIKRMSDKKEIQRPNLTTEEAKERELDE